jgi:hypothetical protein
VVLDLRYAPSDPEEYPNPVALYFNSQALPSFALTFKRDGNEAPGSEDIGFKKEPQKVTRIYATRPVVAFLQEAAEQQLKDWGLPESPVGRIKLEGTVRKFTVEEKFVYWAEVEIDYVARGSDESPLWQGTVKTHAMNAGVARSSKNYKEALSDAVRENLKELMATPAFREACIPKRREAAVADGTTPASLKIEVERLMKEGLEEALLIAYVRQARVTVPFSANDVIAWKSAGIPAAVVTAALEAAAASAPRP